MKPFIFYVVALLGAISLTFISLSAGTVLYSNAITGKAVYLLSIGVFIGSWTLVFVIAYSLVEELKARRK